MSLLFWLKGFVLWHEMRYDIIVPSCVPVVLPACSIYTNINIIPTVVVQQTVEVNKKPEESVFVWLLGIFEELFFHDLHVAASRRLACDSTKRKLFFSRRGCTESCNAHHDTTRTVHISCTKSVILPRTSVPTTFQVECRYVFSHSKTTEDRGGVSLYRALQACRFETVSHKKKSCTGTVVVEL